LQLLVQIDDETGDKFFTEGHQHATAWLGASGQVAWEAIRKGLPDIDWNSDFSKHQIDYCTVRSQLDTERIALRKVSTRFHRSSISDKFRF
jgi:hypothetical protein